MKKIDENKGTGGFVTKAVQVVKENPKTSLIVAFGIGVALLMLL